MTLTIGNNFTIKGENNVLEISHRTTHLISLSAINNNLQMLSQEFVKLDEKDRIYMTMNGTVKYIDLEGGFYGIVTVNDEKYIPINLQGDLREKTKINVQKCYAAKNQVSIYMWGKLIYIEEYSIEE